MKCVSETSIMEEKKMLASFGSGNQGAGATNTVAGEVGENADQRTRRLVNAIADTLNGSGGVTRAANRNDRRDLRELLNDIQRAARTDRRPTLTNAVYRDLLQEANSLM